MIRPVKNPNNTPANTALANAKYNIILITPFIKHDVNPAKIKRGAFVKAPSLLQLRDLRFLLKTHYRILLFLSPQ